MKSNFSEIKNVLNTYSPICACLQETKHNTVQVGFPSGYDVIKSPRKRNDGHDRGTAILIGKNTNYENIPLTTNLQAVAAKIWLDKWYTVCSIYLPPENLRREESAALKRELLELIQQLPKPFLLLGDMNAKHHLWKETIDNERGKIFEHILIEEDITLINSDNFTHYSPAYGTFSTIDLSISSSDCYLDFHHTVADCLHGSDHYPIIIEKLTTPVTKTPSFRFKTEKADWNSFQQLTENFEFESHHTINQKTDELTKHIISAATESIPISNTCGRKTPMPWWTNDCKKAHTERKRCERAQKRNNSESNRIAYKRARATCRYIFNKARRASWRAFVSSLTINTNLEKIHKRIRKIKGKFSQQPPPLLKNDQGTLTEEPSETSEIFGKSFAKVSSPENYSPQFKKFKQIAEKQRINFASDQSEQYNCAFSKEEFDHALSTTTETSPGYDKITYSMIKNAHSSLKAKILELYNEIFINEDLPLSWKVAIIIPLRKPGKDTSNPLNYRPISLTSCLCKLLEKMINSRLMWYIEKNSILSSCQSGFRKNRSTTDSLIQFQYDIENAISRGEHTIAVFFDLTKAYDMTWKYGILRKFYNSNMRGHLPIFIQNFLSDRRIRVKVNNFISEEHKVEEGIPQGSVLSCTTFALGIDDCFSELPEGVKYTLYVDDLMIYYSSRTAIVAERQIQSAIRALEKWCDETGFIFSTTKTISMHICRKRNCGKTAQLNMKKQAIPHSDKHKFLGLTVDDGLRWTSHVEQLKRDCQKKVNTLKMLSHTEWGADTKTLQMLYQTLIKSKIDYGSEVYESTSKTNVQKLGTIRNQCLRIATGAFKSSPIKSLEVLTSTLPIDLTQDMKLLNYLTRILVNRANPIHEMLPISELSPNENQEQDPSTPTKRVFIERCKRAISMCNVEISNVIGENPPENPPWICGRLTVCKDVTTLVKREVPPMTLKLIHQGHIREHSYDSYRIYTDGSKTNQGVAYAIYSTDFSISKKLNECTSIFTAELAAILAAIERSNGIAQNKITIITDSKSSIQAIQVIYTSNPIVQQIQNSIKRSNKQFQLCWVPSHIGILGNEKADKLALEATRNEIVDPHPNTRGDIKAFIRKKCREKWKEQWEGQGQTNKLREITNSIHPLPNSSCPDDRLWERKLMRLRIGHSRHTHGYLMCRGEPPICEDCNEGSPLTIKHILTECPLHNEKRQRYLNSTAPTMKQMLKESDTSFNGPIYNFIKDIDLLSKL